MDLGFDSPFAQQSEEVVQSANALPPTDETFCISQSELVVLHLKRMSSFVISWETVDYIDTLEDMLPYTVCPIRVPGDGNCLLHAISHAVWGRQTSYHEALRELLREELTLNEEFYRTSVDKLKEDEESQGYTAEEYAKFLGDANSTHAFLGFIHLFAMSNVLKRPILLYASEADIKAWGVHEEGCAGTFLPTRHGAGCCAEPIALGWSNEKKNHIVPLCPVQQSRKPIKWPYLDVVFKKTLKNGETIEHYLAHARLNEQRRQLTLDRPLDTEEAPTTDDEDEREYNVHATFQFIHPTKGRAISQILYNFKDDPYEVVRKFFDKHGFDAGHVKTVGDFLAKRRMDAIRSGRFVPPKNNVRIERQPKTTCKHIPTVDEPICITNIQNNTFKQIYHKILQFNEELKSEPSSPHPSPQQHKSTSRSAVHNKRVHIMDEKEQELLQGLAELLTEHAQNFNIAEFQPEMLDLIPKLLTWPLDRVWPVIDLARTLILHSWAANYYYKTNINRANIFTILLGTIQMPDLTFNNRQLAVKFVMNLFRQPCLAPLLITHSNTVISVLIMCVNQLAYDEKDNVKLLTYVTQVFLNYATMWKAGPPTRAVDHNETLSKIIKCLFNLLSKYQSSELIVFNVLVALGTIIQKDGRIKISSTEIEPFAHPPHSVRVRECAQHIIQCISAPLIEIQLSPPPPLVDE